MEKWMTTPGNHTSTDPDIGEIIQKVVGTVMVTILAVVGIIGNISNLVIIPRIPEGTLGEATRVFYSALAAVDLVTASMLLISAIFLNYNEWISSTSGDAFCKMTGFLGTCAPPVGASFIFLLNVDRYVQVTRPFSHENRATRKKAIVSVVIATLFIICVVLLCVSLSDKSFSIITFQEQIGFCQVDFSDPSFLPQTVTICACLWIIAILLIVMYADILRITRRHSRQISAQENVAARLVSCNDNVQTVCSTVTLAIHDPSHNMTEVEMNTIQTVNPIHQVPPAPSPHDPSKKIRDNNRKLKNDRKALRQTIRTLRTPLIVTGCYWVSWLPYTIALTYASASHTRLHKVVFKVVASMAVSNCTVNILVNVFTRSDFKKTFRKVLCRRPQLG